MEDPPPPPGGAQTEEVEDEEQLRRECEELTQRLGQDPLTFENKALEVQLEQMKIDYKSLQEDFQSMGDHFSQRISEMTAQLDDQRRAASQHQGHADCLSDLFHFHEDQVRLAASYWRAQCEKRDDSIKFLSLKLQEYTVPSAEYQSRRALASSPVDALTANGLVFGPPGATGISPVGSAGTHFAPSGGQSVSNAYQALLQQHAILCQEAREQEDVNAALEREFEESELLCASLRGSKGLWAASARARAPTEDGDISSMSGEQGRERETLTRELAEECERLQAEADAAEEALRSARNQSGALPAWANHCVWRDELDVRAGQLERISLQFDATKRLLDAANEELQWQAMSAEALRMRLSDVQRAAEGEEAKAEDLRADHRQAVTAVEALLRRFEQDSAIGPQAGPAPHVCHRAQELLESIRRSDRGEPLSPTASSPTRSPTRR